MWNEEWCKTLSRWELKRFADRHHPQYYGSLKMGRWLFYTPHRKGKTRGIGGIFSIACAAATRHGVLKQNLAFWKDVGKHLCSHPHCNIIERNRNKPFGHRKNKAKWQLIRCKADVAWSLICGMTEGTRFGLFRNQFGGRVYFNESSQNSHRGNITTFSKDEQKRKNARLTERNFVGFWSLNY